MKKSKVNHPAAQKLKRLPRAGIIYAVRSQDIIAIAPRVSTQSVIEKLNSNNNKVITRQFSETSWNSTDTEETVISSNSKSTEKSETNEKNTSSISTDNFMQHLFVEKINIKKQVSTNNYLVHTNQNSLMVHRGSFDSKTKSNLPIEGSKKGKQFSVDSTESSSKDKSNQRHKKGKKDKTDQTDQVENKDKGEQVEIKDKTVMKTHNQARSKDKNGHLEVSDTSKRNDRNRSWEKSMSITDSHLQIPSGDLKRYKVLHDAKGKDCAEISDPSCDVYEERTNDDLLTKFKDTSLELSKLKLKFNELLIENSCSKQMSENLTMEIENLKYENSNVKTRNETLAAKNLENQNLSRIIENLNKKVQELCLEIEQSHTRDSDKTRRVLELEKNVVDLQEKSSTCTVEMEHLRYQLSQKDLELKRLSHNQKVDEEKDLHMKLIHNELIELRGNIRVLCRLKPEPNNLIQILNNETLQLPSQRPKSVCPIYNFNRAFRPNASQSDVFTEVRQLITSFVDGYNVNMITYGQSGSGKTFTMIGTKEEPGIVTHSIREVFKLCKQRTTWTFRVCLSVLEIYNETIFDLLTANQTMKPIWRKRTQIHDDGKCIHIKGLSEIEIKHEEELLKYIVNSGKNRASCMTTQNSDSSRSHFIVMLRIYGKNSLQNCSSQGVLMLCDLAGSENCTSSLSDNSMTESKYISKSLTVLGRVFEALYNKLVVIPFRDSKLTHILKPSLSGDAKFAFIVTISGKSENLNNTVRVLNLAKKVAQISLGQPRKNTINTMGRAIARAEILCQSR